MIRFLGKGFKPYGGVHITQQHPACFEIVTEQRLERFTESFSRADASLPVLPCRLPTLDPPPLAEIWVNILLRWKERQAENE
jgi:hypothetical protein